MNERIKELAQQAGCAWWEGRALRDMTQCQPELEKFAELIVRECAGVDLYWLNRQDRHSVVEKIRKHFGIEE